MSRHQWNFDVAGAREVVDRHVLHRVAVGQERHRQRRHAREAGRQVVHVLHRDVAAERPQPGVEVLDVGLGEVAGQLADEPLGRHPEEALRALLGAAGADDVVVAVHLLDEHRDLVVGVRHVDVGPHDDPPAGRRRAGAPGRAGAAVVGVADQADALDRRQVDLRAVVEPSSTTMISYEYGDAVSACWMRSISVRRWPRSL